MVRRDKSSPPAKPSPSTPAEKSDAEVMSNPGPSGTSKGNGEVLVPVPMELLIRMDKKIDNVQTTQNTLPPMIQKGFAAINDQHKTLQTKQESLETKVKLLERLAKENRKMVEEATEKVDNIIGKLKKKASKKENKSKLRGHQRELTPQPVDDTDAEVGVGGSDNDDEEVDIGGVNHEPAAGGQVEAPVPMDHDQEDDRGQEAGAQEQHELQVGAEQHGPEVEAEQAAPRLRPKRRAAKISEHETKKVATAGKRRFTPGFRERALEEVQLLMANGTAFELALDETVERYMTQQEPVDVGKKNLKRWVLDAAKKNQQGTLARMVSSAVHKRAKGNAASSSANESA